jgi:hypothetical protein
MWASRLESHISMLSFFVKKFTMHCYFITSTISKGNKCAQKPTFCKMTLLLEANAYPAQKKKKKKRKKRKRMINFLKKK